MSAERILSLPSRSDADFRSGSVFFVGAGNAIIRYAGFTVLADSSLFHAPSLAGLRRRRRPEVPLDLAELPPLDIAVLCGLRGDPEAAIERRYPRTLPILTTPHAAAALAARGFGAAHGLARGESMTVWKGQGRMRLTATAGKHGPGLLGALLPPVMGSRLEFLDPAGALLLRLCIAGDTSVPEHVRDAGRGHADADLTVLHMGGTPVFAVLLSRGGPAAHDVRVLNPRTAIVVHGGDAPAFRSSLGQLVKEVRAAGLHGRVGWLVRGETCRFEVPASRLAGTVTEGVIPRDSPSGAS